MYLLKAYLVRNRVKNIFKYQLHPRAICCECYNSSESKLETDKINVILNIYSCNLQINFNMVVLFFNKYHKAVWLSYEVLKDIFIITIKETIERWTSRSRVFNWCKNVSVILILGLIIQLLGKSLFWTNLYTFIICIIYILAIWQFPECEYILYSYFNEVSIELSSFCHMLKP